MRTREQRRRRGCTCEAKGRVGEEVPVYHIDIRVQGRVEKEQQEVVRWIWEGRAGGR